ncbi:DUF262 domain-containing protein [Streptococcus sp. 121]|nr:DUF262 domain-containing protein [Streptococcus sp. 121]
MMNFTAMTIAQLLGNSQLHIPNYQRPYKWTRKQIRNLFYDIKELIENPTRVSGPYHLGSLILHHHQGKLEIVDGQQRLISISLLLHTQKLLNLYPGAQNILKQEHISTSLIHAQENHEEWVQLLAQIDSITRNQIIDYLINSCYLSVIELPDDHLSEAFQLFDSQNNRGKPLEPHDLLKAYHLRSIPSERQTEALISKWEELVNDTSLNLKDLFDKHLFRLRHWVNGETGFHSKKRQTQLRFTEDSLNDFKGVSLEEQHPYPYLTIYKLLAEQNLNFPQSLIMPIINGEHFFKYIEASHQHFIHLEKLISEKASHDSLLLIRQNNGKFQRNKNLLFNIVAIFVDRFGPTELTTEIIDTFTVWAFYPRTAKRVLDSTIAKYAAGGSYQHKPVQKVFQLIQQSQTPNDFLQKLDREQFENHTLQSLLKEIL